MQEENSKKVNKLGKFLPKKGKKIAITVYVDEEDVTMLNDLKKLYDTNVSDSSLLRTCLKTVHSNEIGN